MQFKHPEILWALFLLIIPVIVHLFQLRRFQKVTFTNVRLLKTVTRQTRKSATLKKWLVLLSRLLALAGLIFAFAQPFKAEQTQASTNVQNIIYLDNSFSMESRDEKGALLFSAVQGLLEHIPENEELHLFTNNEDFFNTRIGAVKNELLQLSYTNRQLLPEEIMLKARNHFSSDTAVTKNLIWISDFQQKASSLNDLTNTTVRVWPVKMTPQQTSNISIDSVYISAVTANTLEIDVLLQKSETDNNSQPVSLYLDDRLLAKASAEFNNEQKARVTFTIPSNKAFTASLTVDDSGLSYDNQLFFNLNLPEKIYVLSVNATNANFLERIYTDDEFSYSSANYNQLNFSLIEQQNLIILNQLPDIRESLFTALINFVEKGGYLIIIPPEQQEIGSYNRFLNRFGIRDFKKMDSVPKKVTGINFDHPVFKNVFEERVTNFQYPETRFSFHTNQSVVPILRYQDGSPFLFNTSGVYVFTSPLEATVSDFINSPLVVPVFYNIARNSMPLPRLYYDIGTSSRIAVKTKLVKDDVLYLENDEMRLIPMQQSFSNRVELITGEGPDTPGIYNVKNGDELLQKLSFNYPRDESTLVYDPESVLKGESVTTELGELYEKFKKENEVKAFWKWFVIFALVFLAIEMLLIKYFK
ncbi:BatA domain-containing protein [Ascidiimonas aurantiaca]|uniref:BatA domain-containing protein n=1 Tax=Ascidiimonas aurantiaca TaxID=1685432 RepID=UPI0030ED35B0